MHLNRITLSNYRNIESASLDFSPGINCIYGSNGAGKTNLIDAVHYLSMTKSYFSTSDQFILRYGCDEAIVSGDYIMDDGCTEHIAASIRKGEKCIKRNGKQYTRFSDHIGLVPIVMVSPSDSALINDSGDGRRRYMNFILSQIDRMYLSHIQQYNQLLLRRNRLLRDGCDDAALLDTITFQMVPHAVYIFDARNRLCEQLLPVTKSFYKKISDSCEEISIAYSSQLHKMPFIDLMKENEQKDKILGYTWAGIQRDELSFELDGYPLRKCGSQGQQKTFLLALKMAQMEFMKGTCRTTPILLLDDVFDKLDMHRVECLMNVVSTSGFGQIFVTESNKVRISAIMGSFNAQGSCFTVEDGTCSAL